MIKITWLTLLCLVVLSNATEFGGYEEEGVFCQSHPNCMSNCCYRDYCASENTCDMNNVLTDFEKQSYCDINQECENRCCIEGRCRERIKCFWKYEFPIIIGVIAVLALIILLFLLFLLLKFGCAIFKKAEEVGSKG